MPLNIAILPAGQWGTALAIPAARGGHRVRLWLRSGPRATACAAARENRMRLPGIRLPERVEVYANLAQALDGADLVILAPASRGLRHLCRCLLPFLPPDAVVVSAMKGIDPDGPQRLSEVIAGELPGVGGRLAVLSGPNFAVEVARELPTGTVVASSDTRVAEFIQKALMTEHFRIWTNTDMVGVELGGALKNVIAIGVGLSDGLCMGHNARAALITRGLAEIMRLGVALGADQQTFAGLSGLGDLVLTCTGDLSRNRQAGLSIARGTPATAVLQQSGTTVEGVLTTRAALGLAALHRVQMPIATEIYHVLYDDLDPRACVARLMTRERSREHAL